MEIYDTMPCSPRWYLTIDKIECIQTEELEVRMRSISWSCKNLLKSCNTSGIIVVSSCANIVYLQQNLWFCVALGYHPHLMRYWRKPMVGNSIHVLLGVTAAFTPQDIPLTGTPPIPSPIFVSLPLLLLVFPIPTTYSTCSTAYTLYTNIINIPNPPAALY